MLANWGNRLIRNLSMPANVVLPERAIYIVYKQDNTVICIVFAGIGTVDPPEVVCENLMAVDPHPVTFIPYSKV
jgi:hypothetical protein